MIPAVYLHVQSRLRPVGRPRGHSRRQVRHEEDYPGGVRALCLTLLRLCRRRRHPPPSGRSSVSTGYSWDSPRGCRRRSWPPLSRRNSRLRPSASTRPARAPPCSPRVSSAAGCGTISPLPPPSISARRRPLSRRALRRADCGNESRRARKQGLRNPCTRLPGSRVPLVTRVVAEDQGEAVVAPLKTRDRARIVPHVPEMLVPHIEQAEHEDLADHPMGRDDHGPFRAGQRRETRSYALPHLG